MLIRLDLVLTTEAAGRMAAGEVVVGEEIEDTESLGVIYTLKGTAISHFVQSHSKNFLMASARPLWSTSRVT